MRRWAPPQPAHQGSLWTARPPLPVQRARSRPCPPAAGGCLSPRWQPLLGDPCTRPEIEHVGLQSSAGVQEAPPPARQQWLFPQAARGTSDQGSPSQLSRARPPCCPETHPQVFGDSRGRCHSPQEVPGHGSVGREPPVVQGLRGPLRDGPMHAVLHGQHAQHPRAALLNQALHQAEGQPRQRRPVAGEEPGRGPESRGQGKAMPDPASSPSPTLAANGTPATRDPT